MLKPASAGTKALWAAMACRVWPIEDLRTPRGRFSPAASGRGLRAASDARGRLRLAHLFDRRHVRRRDSGRRLHLRSRSPDRDARRRSRDWSGAFHSSFPRAFSRRFSVSAAKPMAVPGARRAPQLKISEDRARIEPQSSIPRLIFAGRLRHKIGDRCGRDRARSAPPKRSSSASHLCAALHLNEFFHGRRLQRGGTADERGPARSAHCVGQSGYPFCRWSGCREVE